MTLDRTRRATLTVLSRAPYPLYAWQLHQATETELQQALSSANMAIFDLKEWGLVNVDRINYHAPVYWISSAGRRALHTNVES